jgi:hypothetical protein
MVFIFPHVQLLMYIYVYTHTHNQAINFISDQQKTSQSSDQKVMLNANMQQHHQINFNPIVMWKEI